MKLTNVRPTPANIVITFLFNTKTFTSNYYFSVTTTTLSLLTLKSNPIVLTLKLIFAYIVVSFISFPLGVFMLLTVYEFIFPFDTSDTCILFFKSLYIINLSIFILLDIILPSFFILKLSSRPKLCFRCFYKTIVRLIYLSSSSMFAIIPSVAYFSKSTVALAKFAATKEVFLLYYS